VVGTEEYSEDINVDLDALGMVVGIERLDTSVSIPLDALRARYHIQASTLARLVTSLQPLITCRLSFFCGFIDDPFNIFGVSGLNYCGEKLRHII
jgi:hypothetical protein